MATASMSIFLRRLTRGMAAETLRDESDRQLVERLLAGRDEAVFETVVRRHGPMVYRVCWRVLQQEQDTEDAFQATFLILAQRLHTVRQHASLASWLHGTAHRVAHKAKAQAATRRRHEQKTATEKVPPDEVTWRELRAVLDAQLQRLPERWRLPLILCYLEGQTQDEAAKQLGCSQRTLRRRLEEAKAALSRRLTGRGVVWPAALSAVLLSDCLAPAARASAALASGLVSSTVEAAACIATGQTARTAAVSAKVAALTEGVLKTMFTSKLKIATAALVLLTVAVGAGWLLCQTQAADQPPSPNVERPTAQDPGKPKANDGPGLPRVAMWQEKVTLPGVTDLVRAIAFSPDGKILATESGNNAALNLWDAATGRHQAMLRPPYRRHRLVGFAADGRVVTASYDGAYVILWDPATGKDQPGIRTDGVVVLSPDGRVLASGGANGTVRLWDLAAAKEQATLVCGKDRIFALAFSGDGKTLATASGGEVTLWNVQTKKQLGMLRTAAGEVWSVVAGWQPVKNPVTLPNPVLALSPDGRTLATNRVAALDQEQALAGKAIPLDPASTASLGDVKLWDVASGKEKRTLRGHTGAVLSVLFAPDGAAVATWGKDNIVRVWDAKTGEAWATVELGDPFASRVAFSPDSRSIITADAGAAAKFWDVRTGRPQATLAGLAGRVCHYAFAPDGRTLATAVGGGPLVKTPASVPAAAVPAKTQVVVTLWRLTEAPAGAKPPAPTPETPPKTNNSKPAPTQEKRAATPGTPQAEYETLRNHYFEDLGTYTDAYRAAQTDGERDKLKKEMLAKRKALGGRVLELARRHPTEPFAVEALTLVVQTEMAPASAPEPLSRRKEALDLLLD